MHPLVPAPIPFPFFTDPERTAALWAVNAAHILKFDSPHTASAPEVLEALAVRRDVRAQMPPSVWAFLDPPADDLLERARNKARRS